jgi:hypothetical protein
MELKIEFTDKEITPWRGMILMKQLIEKTKINEVIERLPLLHRDQIVAISL